MEKGAKKWPIIMIMIAGLVIVGFASYFISYRIFDRENNDDDTNLSTENNNNNNENNNFENNTDPEGSSDLMTADEFFEQNCYTQEEDGSLGYSICIWYSNKDAEELMEKYRGLCGGYYSTLSESRKNEIAFQNLTGRKEMCQNVRIEGSSVCHDNEEVLVYDYDDVLNKKKELFGNASVLDNDNVYSVGGHYNYNSDLNLYVFQRSLSCEELSNEDRGVVNAYTKEDQLFVFAFNINSVFGIGVSSIERSVYIFEKDTITGNYYLTDIKSLKNG